MEQSVRSCGCHRQGEGEEDTKEEGKEGDLSTSSPQLRTQRHGGALNASSPQLRTHGSSAVPDAGARAALRAIASAR